MAEFFNGAASAAVRATIGGIAGAAWAPNGKVRVAFSFAFRGDRILAIELLAERRRLEELGVEQENRDLDYLDLFVDGSTLTRDSVPHRLRCRGGGNGMDPAGTAAFRSGCSRAASRYEATR